MTPETVQEIVKALWETIDARLKSSVQPAIDRLCEMIYERDATIKALAARVAALETGGNDEV